MAYLAARPSVARQQTIMDEEVDPSCAPVYYTAGGQGPCGGGASATSGGGAGDAGCRQSPPRVPEEDYSSFDIVKATQYQMYSQKPGRRPKCLLSDSGACLSSVAHSEEDSSQLLGRGQNDIRHTEVHKISEAMAINERGQSCISNHPCVEINNLAIREQCIR
ncbi:uncharacterized protein LOC119377639 [Rhipicephalus sanguineus]|uniref:uncharacterized protein LOC119377639 n=1 Tax=Rhipicephalus sanguineus TaxID=34632 RepID=UPI0018958E4A|nr:uncharacterized protein LOC119377639 [Rhipicephalus sanguineus]